MIYGIISLSKTSPVVDTEVENQYTLNYSFKGLSGAKTDLPNVELARIYLRSYNPNTGVIGVHAFKVVRTELAGSRVKNPRSLIENEQNDGFRPWAGDLGVDTTNGVFSELTSAVGMSYLPVEGSNSNIDIAFREEIRNVDLQNFVQARTQDIKDIVQEISETYALKSENEAVSAKVQEQKETIAEILETMGANSEDLTLLKQNVKDLQDLTTTHTETLTQHTTDIEELKTKTAEHDTKLGTLETDLETQKTALNQAIAKTNENFEKYDTAYNTLNDNQQQLSNAITEQIVPKLNDHTSKLSELETASTDISTLKTDLSEYKTAEDQRHEILDTVLQNIRQDIASNDADISSLQTGQDTLNNNFLDMKSKFDTTLSDMEGYNDEFNTIKTQNAQINTRLGEVENSFTDINAKIDQNSGEISTLKTDVAGLKEKDTSIETALGVLEEKLTAKDTELTTELTTLKTQNEKDHSDLLDLIGTTETAIRKDMTDADSVLSSDISALQTEVESNKQQVAQSIIKNNAQDATIQNMVDKVTDLNTNVKSFEGIIENINTDLGTAKDDIETLKTDTSTLRTDHDNLNTDYTGHKEYVLGQLKDVKTVQDAHTTQLSELDKSITSLGEKFDGELQNATQETKYELKALKDVVTVHTSQIDEINSSIEQLQININDLDGSTKAVILNSEDEIDTLGEDTFGLLCLGDTQELPDKDYSQILVDIAQIKTENSLLLQRVQTLEAENQDLKVKIKGE